MSESEQLTHHERAAKRRLCSQPLPDGSMHFWRMAQLWELAAGLPVMKVRTRDLPGFAEVRWFGGPRNIRPTCRAVAEHARDFLAADLSYPIILSVAGDVLDGMHRICKAWLLGIEEIDAVQLREELPEPRWRVLLNGDEVETQSPSSADGDGLAPPTAFDMRDATEADAEAASALVLRSFNELAAADWEPAARQVLQADSTPVAMRGKIKDATYVAAALVGGKMIGFLLMPRPTLLGMLFVHPHWVRRGVGRALWEGARSQLEAQCPEVRTVELNATPFAVPFYRALGFAPISAEFERDGCRMTRMACWLPGRKFGAECIPPGAAADAPPS